MTEPTTQATPPRPPFQVRGWMVAIAAILAVTLAAVVFINLNPKAPDAVGAPPTPSLTPVVDDLDEVTGCLVPGQDAAMLLETQRRAPRTPNGAAEFAAAVWRVSGQRPALPADQVQLIEDHRIITNGDVGTYVDAAPDLFPEDAAVRKSSVLGEWLLDDFTGDSAMISIQLAYVVDGVIQPQTRSSVRVKLTWTELGWSAEVLEARLSGNELYQAGTAFTAGC